MRIDLLRHGSTGRRGFLDGRTDPDLSTEGWAQVEAQTAGRRWAGIVTSPRVRARAAAERVASVTATPCTVDAGWAEYGFGDWDGRARAEIEREDGGRDALAAFYTDPVASPAPGGERWTDFEMRVRGALERVIDAGLAPVLVVAHAGAIRCAIGCATGMARRDLWSLRIGYGTLAGMEIGRGADGVLWGEIVELAQPRMPDDR